MEKDFKRIVVKVGTSTLAYGTGKLNLKRIENLVRVLSDMRNRGIEVVLVSSGAVGAGIGRLNLSGRPSDTRKKQALAAIGQASLISTYDRFFSEYGHLTAQVLLTKYILDGELTRLNAKNTFNTMFSYGVVPIVNENDVISTFELEFGDNDTLSAYVARLVEADALIILSDIDGFYDGNPAENKAASVIPEISVIDERISALAGGAGTKHGTGGMRTKLGAAQMVTENGIDMYITNGSHPENIYDILDGKPVGTHFKAKEVH